MLKTSFAVRPRVVASVLFLLAMLSGRAAVAATETSVVISQVYGGGGNSGATYKNDFIELFNPTASAVTLTNYSIQYGSAVSTTNLAVFALPASITIQPGQFYLIQGAAGTGGTVNLTPDTTITLNLSGTVGKVALVSSTTAVVGCPTTDPTLVDFVGFGGTTTAVNCSLGSPAPLLSNTTSAIRTNVCSETSNNAADFTAVSPAPRNTSTPFNVCGGGVMTTPLTATGLATPAAVFSGSADLLTVKVIPATLPASSSIQVSVNLGAIAGSTTQKFYDDGTNGDITAGDNTFSYSVTPATTGTFSFPVTVTDSQLRTASATIALTVNTPPPFVTIRTIQAKKPSTYATQTVTTSGIVIGVTTSSFYMEALDADTTPVTPEGILVYTGATALPSYIALGAIVQVTGVVNTYPTTGPTPGTEIDAPQTFTLVSSGNPLPVPIKITAAMDSPSGGIYQFTKYEGMRVAIDSLTTTSGTGSTLTEQTETNVSNGRFYGVVTGVPRPFREPGIAINDTLFGTVPAGVPIWDSNPELLYISSAGLGGAAIDVTSNATITGISGVMDFSFGSPEIFLDKAITPTVSGLMTAVPVLAPAATEFTAATFNMERFYNDISDADNPGSSVVVVTTAAYQRRLAKASLAIRNVLLTPDILGVEELENINVLTDLANKISADAVAAGQTDPVYLPYLFLATDGTGINTGVLVKSTRVTTVKVEQFGLATTFTNSTGAQALLNDRTPLVLHAGIKRASGPDYPVTFIVVHQRSLISVDDPTSTGATVRLKREAQAEFLANLIQGYQAAGEHVISVGDYNGFEFSDGFVDVLGVTTGKPVPASQVVTPPAAGLVSPNLTDLVTLLPAAQRQSYVETGSAQVLDHIVVTPDLVPLETRLVYAHIDADFPLIDQNDATTPLRVSDHDPAVAYFTVPPAPLPLVVLSATTLVFGPQLVSTPATKTVTLTNSGTSALAITSITATGAGFTQTNNCGTSVAMSAMCTITVTFMPSSSAPLSGMIAIVTNATSSPDMIALSGTGVAPLVMLSATTIAFGSQLVATPATKAITLTNSGTSPLTVTSISAAGAGYAQTNNCGTSIAVAAACTINVTFTPATSAALAGTVVLVTSATTSPDMIALTGTGVAPVVSLSATTIAFGSQLVATPAMKAITLTNSGTSPLTVTSISATGAGYAQTNNCGASVAVAAACTINVTFTPATSAALAGTVVLVTSATTSPDMIALTGTGVAPVVALSATTVAFGSQLVATPATKAITLTNSGTSALAITSITATGTGYSQTNTCGTSVAIAAVCTINVTFTPTTSTALAGTITILSSASSSPNTISLTGTGVSPIVTLSSKTVTFGTLLVTTQASNSVTLTNSGTAALTITSITAVGAGYSQTNSCGTGLAAGASCPVTIAFTPGTTGPLAGSVSIVTSAASSPDTITLTGTGGDFSLATTTPAVSVKDGSTATLQFSATAISGYTGSVSLTCLVPGAGEVCTLVPATLTLGATAQTFTVTVSTTSEYLASVTTPDHRGPMPRKNKHGVYEGLGGLAMAALVGCFSRRSLRQYRKAVSVGLAMCLLMMVAGCSTNYNQINPAGTPLGPQTVTISATANGLTRTTTVVLTVQ